MIIELVIALVVLAILIVSINYIYQFAINKVIGEKNANKDMYNTYLYEIDSIESLQNNLILPYCGIFVVVYLVNILKQKVITIKLNKELEKNK